MAAALPRRREELDQDAIRQALRAVRRGDFRVRLPGMQTGIAGEIAEAFNEVVELNQRTSVELRRIAKVVGRDGRIGQRASIGAVSGEWANNIESVNELIENLTEPTAEVSRVLGAVARGDAVKYSPRGGDVIVSASREQRNGQDWAVLAVRDNGLGIPRGEVGRIFEPYYRASNIARMTSGAGVGLVGTRHIVEQHQGEITVESVVGEGTTFTVRLPVSREHNEVLDP